MLSINGEIKKITPAPTPSSPNPYGKVGDKFVINIKNQSSIVVKLENYDEMPLSDSWPYHYFISPENWCYQNTQTKWTLSGYSFLIESENNGSVIEGKIELNPAAPLAFRALANNRYVCAEKAGAEKLIANRDKVGLWETFDIQNLLEGQVSIKSMANGKFVCIDNSGSGYLIAKNDNVDIHSKFEIEYYSNTTFSLKSMSNKKFVSADLNLNGQLIANRDKAKTWEIFIK